MSNFYEIIPEVKTRTKEVILHYLKETKKRWCFTFTALLKENRLECSLPQPHCKKTKKPVNSQHTHLWEQVISPNVTICKRIAVFCKFIAPVSSNARSI